MPAHTAQVPISRDASADGRPARDLALYERLIDDGIAAADSRGGVIDHVTARRMAIWLISRPQEPDFTRGLIRFARSGAISHALKAQLRNYALHVPASAAGRQAHGIHGRPRNRPRPHRHRLR